MSSEPPLIDYEELAKTAMRGVVRSVLKKTAKSGLPGDHHFFISFDTTVDGVTLSKRLREKYHNEMTIVLQHRFWDLNVEDDYFEVKLTFDGIPERLRIPFDAIKVFFDPSVRYGLQFDDSADSALDATGSRLETPADTSISPAQTAGTTRASDSRSASTAPQSQDNANQAPAARASSREDSAAKAQPAAKTSPGKKSDGTGAEALEPVAETSSAEIVSLDAFRKKN